MPKRNVVKSTQHPPTDNTQPSLNLDGLSGGAERFPGLTDDELIEVINEVGSDVREVGPSKTMMLSRMTERQWAKEAEIMKLSCEEITQRDQMRQLIVQLDFRGAPDKFLQAHTAIAEWKQHHPDDPRLQPMTDILNAMEKGASLLR